MSEPTPEPAGLARVGGEDLEGFVRQRIQGFSQELLDEEVTALLGRWRYQRRTGVDAAPGYRNGHGRPRRLARRSGTVRRRRPRVRGLEARFERVYPRAYGGTRMAERTAVHAVGLSPRVRGNRPLIIFVPRIPGSIPARTGEPSSCRRPDRRPAVYPRAYGGTCGAAARSRFRAPLTLRIWARWTGSCASWRSPCWTRWGLRTRSRGRAALGYLAAVGLKALEALSRPTAPTRPSLFEVEPTRVDVAEAAS